eukprot:365535-Chlamydomonas_euryale.AAC.65
MSQNFCCIAALTGDKRDKPAPPAPDGDSDWVYLAKVTALSFGGAALIKYGSLLPPFSALPFSSDPISAVLIVAAPVVVFSTVLLTEHRSEK